jgi:hypothetical protein
MTALSLPAEGAHVVELLIEPRQSVTNAQCGRKGHVPLAVSEEVLDVIEVSGAPERQRSQQRG